MSHAQRSLLAARLRVSALALLALAVIAPAATASCGGGDSTTPSGTSGGGGVITGGNPTTTATATGGAGGAGAGGSSSSGGGGGAGGAPADNIVRLLAIGDTGEGNEAQNLVGDRMSEKCQMVGGCDAVLVNGDNFYDQGVQSVDDPQWGPKFEQPYDRPGLNGVPFYVVLGNHDHGPTSSGDKQAQIDYSYLPIGSGPGMRPSDKWRMPAAWYDVQIEHVHLFALDTVDFTNDTQEADMAARVAGSSATWKIVFGHHPRYTSGEHYYDNQLLGLAGMFSFQQAIYCEADMFMTGHDHDLELIDKGRDGDCPNTYFVISGAGAKTREGFDLVPTDPDQLFYNEDIEGFAYMEINGPTMLLEFIDKNGQILHTTTITK